MKKVILIFSIFLFISNFNYLFSLKSANNFFNDGLKKFDQANYKGAIRDFNQAIRLDSNDTDAYYKSGLAKYEIEDYRGAIEDFTQAIKLNPNDYEAYYYRGLANYQLGNIKLADEDYKKTCELNPEFKNKPYE